MTGATYASLLAMLAWHQRELEFWAGAEFPHTPVAPRHRAPAPSLGRKPDIRPSAGTYVELMERGKAVLLRNVDTDCRYWCPTRVWEAWVRGDRWAVRWFLGKANETTYRPRWGQRGHSVAIITEKEAA